LLWQQASNGQVCNGSNEPLGNPIEVEFPGKPIDLESQETTREGFVESQATFNFGIHGIDATTPSPSSSNRKRNMTSILSEEDTIQVSNMSDALRDVAGAINNTCHTETHHDLCKTVMELENFDMD
jgi:hypothetical protein